MSVVHETLKRIREKQLQKSVLSRQTSAPDVKKNGYALASVPVIWILCAVLIAETAFFFREIYVHHKTEQKLKLALLTLNDARGDSLETQKSKSQLEEQVEELKERLNKSYRDHNQLSEEKRRVELDNLQKEKKISELTKKAHQTELQKFELEDEIILLKREISRSATTAPASQNN